MARTRQIEPEFYLDDELAKCSRDARLLLTGLWMLADPAGIVGNRPLRIKAQVFPYDTDIDAAAVSGFLRELEAHGFIYIHEAEGKSCIQVCTSR